MKAGNIILTTSICLTMIVSFLIWTCDAAGPFDGINVDNMLRNPVVVQKQIKCLSCKGPCDTLGTNLKRVIPTAAVNNCRACSTTDRISMGKIVNHVQTYYPKEWQELNQIMRSGRRC